jgi:hypothetical protein
LFKVTRISCGLNSAPGPYQHGDFRPLLGQVTKAARNCPKFMKFLYEIFALNLIEEKYLKSVLVSVKNWSNTKILVSKDPGTNLGLKRIHF